MLANTPRRHRSVDHGMSLLVTATFLPCSLVWDQQVAKEKKKTRDIEGEEEEKGREKKIVHPIGDARGCSEFCRLACRNLYRAAGHDWSKTEKKKSTRLNAHTSSFV